MDDAQVIDFSDEMRKRGPRPVDESQPKTGATRIVRIRTETLRKLLDEHGIPHKDISMRNTEFSIRGLSWHVVDIDIGLVLECTRCLTPSQVVEFIERMERA